MKKSIFKRILSSVMAFAAAVTMVSCGSKGGSTESKNGNSANPSDEGKTKLVVFTYKAGYGDEWLKSLAASFEKAYADYQFEEGKKGVSVEVRGDMRGFTTAQMKESIYDVFFFENEAYYNFLDGTLEDLSSIVNAKAGAGDSLTVLEKLDSQQTDYYGVKENGKTSYYGLPSYIGNYGIIYNIDLFDNYNGYIVCDSFNGYDNISKDKDIKLARCWVHARRYVTDSIKGYKKATLPQVELLNKINELFDIEDKLDEENADLNKIKEARNKLSVTVLNEIKVICKKNIKTKISLFKKAVKYILNHFADLSTFLEDPKIPIHNNKTERAVGLFVTCRKNFQTVCSDESANRNAKLFTIIQTAQANGLNAEKYLEYVLVSLFEKKDPNSLLPWNGSIPDYIKEPF